MNRMTRKEQRQLFGIFFKIGVTTIGGTIGGGDAMIPMMEHEIVQRMKWLDQQEFMDILAVSQATPGIFAVDMASHIGHKLGGVRMALLAALGNVLPSFIIILILATLFQQFKEIQLVEYAFRAIRPVVVALIAAPVFSMARSASLTRYTLWIPLVSTSLGSLQSISSSSRHSQVGAMDSSRANRKPPDHDLPTALPCLLQDRYRRLRRRLCYALTDPR